MERPQKILVAMLGLSGGTTKSLKYEDIVVAAFRRFPDDFALRGYPEYPDSSDIHKPLYGPLKRAGLVRSGNKTFALTARGVEQAKHLGTAQAKGSSLTGNRMPRDLEVELERMLGSAALDLYNRGTRDRILDTDFYAFLGCSVRTAKNDFLGRMHACRAAIEAARALHKPTEEQAQQLGELWSLLGEKFSSLIKRRQG